MLAGHLDRPDWVVVDCRFRLTRPEAGQALYQQGHIPGARYAHLDDDLAAPPQPNDGRHPLPNPEIFVSTLESWGISNSSIVTVYDDASGAIAARLWWMLRWIGHESVFVLDGGIQAWERAGLPLEISQPIWESTKFLLHEVHEEWVVQADEILNEMEQGAILVDADTHIIKKINHVALDELIIERMVMSWNPFRGKADQYTKTFDQETFNQKIIELFKMKSTKQMWMDSW